MKRFYFMTMVLLALCTVAAAQVTNRKGAQPKRLARRAVTELPKPVALPATDITATGFTANWETVPRAEGYAVSVYTRQVIAADGLYTLIDEDFSGITEGSLIEPLGGDEELVNLDDYDYADTPGWSAYAFLNFVPSMVAGLVYSPEIDLSHNDGNYQLVVTVYATDGDQIRITSHGAGEPVVKTFQVSLPNGGTGVYTGTVSFSNGSDHLFFSVINNTGELGVDYIDRIQVQQQLKKNDVVLLPAAVNDAIDAVNEYTGQAVTSVRFANVTKFFHDVTTYYYEVYAAAYQFGYDEEGNFTYDYVGSPYSDLVKVDLAGGNSDVEQPDDDEPVDEPDYPQLVDGTLTLGEFDGQREDDAAYDGGNWYNSPMAFTYNNSGSQTIYLPSELAAIKGADITSVTFSCFADWSYETYDYNSTARLYLSEVDDEAFRVNPDSGYPEWFAFTEADLVSTEVLSLDFATACIEGEDIHITFRLAHPYHYTGKTLLVTVANDSEQCLESGEYVRFYWVKGEKGQADRTALFVNNRVDFLTNYGLNNRITIIDNYENLQREAPAVRFTVDTKTTGIAATTAATTAATGWYSLQGQRIDRPRQAGVYLHNGKKTIIK